MNTITSKNVQDSLGTNCSIRADERNRKYETAHPQQSNSRLLCKDSLVYDLVKQCRKNSLKLLNLKPERILKEDFGKSKIFINYATFS